MRSRGVLSDEQWEKIRPHLPKLSSRGRPWADNRACLEGILWVLRTGARWRDVPEPFPSGSTCWRRLKLWSEQDVWLNMWRAFLRELDDGQLLDWEECFVDGTFASAKKRGDAVGKTKRGKGTKLMVVADGQGIPVGISLHSASPAEVTLVEETLDTVQVNDAQMMRLIADKAYDSAPLRKRLA